MDTQTLSATVAGCVAAILSALAVVLVRRPVYAAVALLVHSLCIAALYAILAAGLVAVGQIIIYSGAIVVLFLFVVTLLPSGGTELGPARTRLVAAIVAFAALVAAFGAMLSGSLPTLAGTLPAGVPAIGHALFGPELAAMELTAPLLLVAIVGAVVIWRRHEPELAAPATQQRPTATPTPTTSRRVVLHR